MPHSAQIGCINKQPRNDPHHRITHVGGFTDRQWKITSDDAITYIETGAWEFFTLVNGRQARVTVANHLGRKYLKTIADWDTPDNLLSLPECP